MRLSFVGPVPPFRGGISQHSALLVGALREAGHEVDVHSWAAQYPKRLYPGDPYAPGARPFPDARFTLRWWDPSSWARVGRAARAADALVVQWVTPFQGPAYRTMQAASGSTPAVAIVHNPVPHEERAVDRRLTRLGLGKVKGALTYPGHAADELGRLLPGVSIVPMAIPPLVELGRTPLPPGPPWRLLFFGFVRPYKGLELAIDAVALLVQRGVPVELTVAGLFWGPVEPWRERMAAAGVDGAVTLRPGYVPDEEVQELFASHHVVVVPYRSAPQSAIVPLAYAAGRPVAATNVGGLAGQVTEGVTGALADEDAAAFADAVERVLADMEPLARNATEHAPTWPTVADSLVRLVDATREDETARPGRTRP
jgi:glycosyltransferase involved in cell wall biosynthesis